MAPTGAELIITALTQVGKPYKFGAEARDLNAKAWDCSELVEVVCRHHGVTPTIPDGAYNQWMHCRKHAAMVSIQKAKETKGALLFIGSGVGVGRNAIWHVAFSRGDGTTVEARSTKYGTGSWPIGNRFQYAALIPGVNHSGPPVTVVNKPPTQLPQTSPLKGNDMKTWLISDGQVLWATNGIDIVQASDYGIPLHEVAQIANQWNLLGWCANPLKADGVPDIKENPELISRLRRLKGV